MIQKIDLNVPHQMYENDWNDLMSLTMTIWELSNWVSLGSEHHIAFMNRLAREIDTGSFDGVTVYEDS